MQPLHTCTWCVHRRKKKPNFKTTTNKQTTKKLNQTKKKITEKNTQKSPTVPRWSDTGALCPGCHGGGTAEEQGTFWGAEESTPQPWVSCGSSTSSHGNLGCPASTHWCEGPGKQRHSKMPLCHTSAKCQASKHSHRVQRGAQDGTREQPSTNTKYGSPRCPCAVTRALG